jgi:hypothetical protein
VATWADPAAYARAVQASYRRNKWAGQARDVIVVSEKGTVRGTLAPVLDTYEVDFFPVGGYGSTTRVYDLAQRATAARPLVILYLGDYDPSGLHMSEVDLPRRLAFHAMREAHAVTRGEARAWSNALVDRYLEAAGLVFRRLALTRADTETLGPRVSFPASDKQHDSRYAWFVQHYGRRCWELDAMNPNELRTRVETALEAEIEPVAWARYVRAEAAERESIETIVRPWNGISGLKPRKTFRRVARQRWPGSYIRGRGPFAVLEPWPDSQSGLAVQLYYSQRLAHEMAASIGRAYEYEHGDARPVRVYDLTKRSRASVRDGSLQPAPPRGGHGEPPWPE